MRLYIGNATKQNFDFMYWVPTTPPARRIQRIEVGRQVAISGELDRAAIDGIIQQHIAYGIIDAKDVAHAAHFVPLCFSVDRPITGAQLTALMTKNAAVLQDLGRQIRREAALASNDRLETDITESGRPERLRVMDMSVVEENHDERDEQRPLAEGFRVVASNDEPGGSRPTAVRRARQRRAA